jgi:hypothetical protein
MLLVRTQEALQPTLVRRSVEGTAKESDQAFITGRKVLSVTSDVTWGVRILIKNKLQNPSVNRETNLLIIINPSLAHVLL